MGRGFLGLVRQPREPFRRVQRFGVQRNAAHHHGDAGGQPPGVLFQAVAVLAKFDGHAGDFRRLGEKALFLLHRDKLGHRLLQPPREGAEVAFRIGGKAPQPRGLHVEIHISAHGVSRSE